MTELIKKALEVDERFKQKLNYWVNIRKRRPDDTWMLNQLSLALGDATVRNYLESKLEIKR